MRDLGVSDELIADFVLKEVESKLTGILKEIPMKEISDPSSFGREQAMSLCLAVAKAAESHALLEQVAKSAQILLGLLQNQDLRGLSDALEAVQSYNDSDIAAAEDGDNDDDDDSQTTAGIFAFLKLHVAGVALMADATTSLQSGQHQLEGELIVANLMDLFQDLKKLDKPWGLKGLEDHLLPFWKQASGRDESKLSAKQRQACDLMIREFFGFVRDGFQSECCNTLTGCLEVLLEQWDMKHADQAASEPGEEPTAAEDPSESLELALPEVLDAIRMREFCCHPFWAAVDAKMPDDLVQLLKDYTDKAFRLCHLVEYVFASRQVLPRLEQTYPSPEMLRDWSQGLVPSLKPYVDSAKVLEDGEKVFANAAAEDLQKQTMSCFEEVGKLTSKVYAEVLTSVEALVSSMNPILAFEPQAKLTLPQTGDWSHVLTRFFEVRLI